MPASLDLIGRGLAFPLGVDARGGVALAEGNEEIRQAIGLIVATRRGARVMRPEFGCRIWELLFAPNDASTWTQAGHHVREALGWWEPRIDVDDVVCAADPGNPAAVEIEITYTIKATHDRRSLVFPFYLIPDEPAAAAARLADTVAAMAEPGPIDSKPKTAAPGPAGPAIRTGTSSRAVPPATRSQEVAR